MNDLIAWGIGIGVVVLMFWALVRDRKRLSGRTVEEYERDLREGKGIATSMMRAGMTGLEKMLKTEVREAEDFLQDEQAGRTSKTTKKPGDGSPPQERENEVSH